MELVLVRDCMTQPAVSIGPDVPVDAALEQMGAANVRRLPVINDRGRLVGIITREEARLEVEKARCSDPENPRHPKVRDVMTAYVYTIGPGDSIADAAQIMVNQSVGALPVVEDGRVVGIVTESDLFEYIARHLDDGEVD